MFDCLHDMGDPLAAARAVHRLRRRRRHPDGRRTDGRRPGRGQPEPVGRVFYGASTLICTPASLDQPGRRALGAQAGPTVLQGILREAGFGRVRVAATTPVNLVIEARH